MTGGCVRRDQHALFLFTLTGDDVESQLALGRDDPAIDILYARQRRRPIAQMRDKILQGRRLPLQLDRYSRRVVQDESSQAVFHGESVDERPEANPLHDTFHGNVAPLGHGDPHPPGSAICASAKT